MIGFLAEKITDFFIENNIIEADEKSIYRYGSEVTLSTILGFILILVISVLGKCVTDGIIFLLCFGTVRVFSGGYHASTYLRCNLEFVSAFILILIFRNIIPLNMEVFISLSLIILSVIIISIYAPVENKNKPLSEFEKKRYRKISIFLSGIWSVSALILILVNITLHLMISITMCTTAILMVVEKIKQITNEKEI